MARLKQSAKGDNLASAAEEELVWRKKNLVRAFFVASEHFDPKTDPTYNAVKREVGGMERAGLPIAEQVVGLRAFLRSEGLDARAERHLRAVACAMAGHSRPDHWIHGLIEREGLTEVAQEHIDAFRPKRHR